MTGGTPESRTLSRYARQTLTRTLVKTVLYRAVMVLTTVAVAWFVTGSAGDAVNIGLAANVLKTGTYYGYERLWNRITWGRRSRREPRPRES